ncbi:MAG: hypothetical protein RMK45_04275 [Armatimonadota bacterium]|nr:hypothetical protein [Armatimonadota bacterium]
MKARWGLGVAVLTIIGTAVGLSVWHSQQNRLPPVEELLRQTTEGALENREDAFEILHKVAQHWLELGRLEECRRTLTLMEQYGGHERRRLALATLWLQLGEVDRARQLASQATNTDILFYHLVADGSFQKFFTALIERTSPDQAYAWVRTTPVSSELAPINRPLLIRAFVEAAAEAGHLDFAERVLRNDKYYPEDLVRLAQAYRKHRRADRADALLDEAVQLWRKQASLREVLPIANALREAGQTARAEAILQQALQHHQRATARQDIRQPIEDLVDFARVAFERGFATAARTAIRHAVELGKSEPKWLVYHILYARELLQDRETLALVRPVVEQLARPDQLVGFYADIGEIDSALRVYQAHKRELKNDYQVGQTLSGALIRAGRVAEALELARASSSLAYSYALAEAARYYQAQGQVESFRKLLEDAPLAQQYNLYSAALAGALERGDFEQARALVGEAQRTVQESWARDRLLVDLANGYLKQGRLQEAWHTVQQIATPDFRTPLMLALVEALRRNSS